MELILATRNPRHADLINEAFTTVFTSEDTPTMPVLDGTPYPEMPPIDTILSVIFKTSLEQGQLPHEWKNANVVPIYKKGGRSFPLNYWPVSL